MFTFKEMAETRQCANSIMESKAAYEFVIDAWNNRDRTSDFVEVNITDHVHVKCLPPLLDKRNSVDVVYELPVIIQRKPCFDALVVVPWILNLCNFFMELVLSVITIWRILFGFKRTTAPTRSCQVTGLFTCHWLTKWIISTARSASDGECPEMAMENTIMTIDEHQGKSCQCNRDNEDLFKFMSFVDLGFYDHQRTGCIQCTISPPLHHFVGSTLRVVYPPNGRKPRIYLRVPFVPDLQPTSGHYLPVNYSNDAAGTNNIDRRLAKLEKFYGN